MRRGERARGAFTARGERYPVLEVSVTGRTSPEESAAAVHGLLTAPD
ncbi:hypothetical protein [Streptomyces sp. CC219B]|nr:hypothetical protein [Streptomyces sp. CC219B]